MSRSLVLLLRHTAPSACSGRHRMGHGPEPRILHCARMYLLNVEGPYLTIPEMIQAICVNSRVVGFLGTAEVAIVHLPLCAIAPERSYSGTLPKTPKPVNLETLNGRKPFTITPYINPETLSPSIGAQTHPSHGAC